MDCVICGKRLRDWPMAFRGQEWCSDLCRKKRLGELPLTERDLETLSKSLKDLAYVDADDDSHFLRQRRREGVVFGAEYYWIEADGLPLDHIPCRAGAVEITQAGDECRWFKCPNCKTRTSGPWIGQKGDA